MTDFTPEEAAPHQAEFDAYLDHAAAAMMRDDKNLIDVTNLLRHRLAHQRGFDEIHATRTLSQPLRSP